jgi:CubicO group peptidase (beta-lactamase class C family)
MRRSLVVLALSVLATTLPAHGQVADRGALVAALDSAAAAHVEDDRVAGISVAVVRGGDALLMKGYGLVDLEWDVPTPTDASASYEIGSVTKQFTAAAVMLLVEEGKLDLDADMTEYLPEFDTQGHAVPLRRLLDHTSGIKGYTEMQVFGELVPKRLPRDTLVSLVEAEPFEFEPGTALIYNNSAYFLLGLIIEKVSGQDYEDFVQERLFDALGMDASYYCSTSGLRDGRAHGYDGSPNGLARKGFLDHTWPYAAGSLCSTAPDLVRWNRALHGGELLSPESYRAMITPMPLEDGTPIRYAMGLGVDDRGGRRIIAHGGGINGFLSDGRYYPDEDLIVVVLQNSTGPRGPGALGGALADLVLGPMEEPVAMPYEGDLSELAGDYTGPARGRRLTMTVSVEDGELVFTPRGSGNGMRPVHVGDTTWQSGGTRLWFEGEGGEVVVLRMDQGGGHYVLRRDEG